MLLESLVPLDPKHCKTLAGGLKSTQILRGELLAPAETTAVPIDADRKLVLIEQLSEPEIVEIARAPRS